MGLSRAILLNILICIVGVCTNQITTSLNGLLNRDRKDLSTFNLSCIVVVHSVSPPESLTSVTIARKTYGESEFSKLVVLETCLSPTFIGNPQLKIFIPPSKRWAATYDTNFTTVDKHLSYLILAITDFQCEDTGTYKCISEVDNGTNVKDTVLGEGVTTAALVSVNLALNPVVEGEDVTLIDAGVNYTYTCNATSSPHSFRNF
uniref:Ig-like domain-containing protein n=1 Tax=Biomphalaria glabrata TaxID=6526 RepID=A0A2C9LQM9_BIOGL